MNRSRRTLGFLMLVPLLIAASEALMWVKPVSASRCGEAILLEVRHGIEVCIHASEPPPPGVDLEHRPTLAELNSLPFTLAEEPQPEINDPVSAPEPVPAVFGLGGIACLGDGTEGSRVQAIYARASDVPDRFAYVVDLIRTYAADADYRINLRASQAGSGGRRVRYAHDATCALSVGRVTLSPTGDDTFRNFVAELKAQGFTRADRKYLAWVDAAVGICGLAELYADDRPTSDNRNNRGPQYARVDAPCWGHADTHELLHMLGAVQDSAPNSSGAGHCIDENDTMCYVDTSGRAMLTRCGSAPAWLVDCGLDDYFNGAPASGAYLATHWDTARSSFLEPSAPLPPPPVIRVSAPSSVFAGNAFSVAAGVSVPSDRTYTVAWSSSRSDCRFTRKTGKTTTYYCPVTAAGSGQITGKVTDSLGMMSAASRTFKLAIPSRRRATAAGLRASDTSVRARTRVVLTGRLIDASNRKRVIGMPVAIFARARGASRWTKIATRRTGYNGAFTFAVAPSRSTAYVLVSNYTRTWASDQSYSVTIFTR